MTAKFANVRGAVVPRIDPANSHGAVVSVTRTESRLLAGPHASPKRQPPAVSNDCTHAL